MMTSLLLAPFERRGVVLVWTSVRCFRRALARLLSWVFGAKRRRRLFWLRTRRSHVQVVLGALPYWGTSSPKLPYSLSRSLLRHARSGREAHSRCSFALSGTSSRATPLLALSLAASPRSLRSRGSFATTHSLYVERQFRYRHA